MKIRESGMPPEDLWVTFFDPRSILSRLLFDGAEDVVEFGCGYGTFTVEAARRVRGMINSFDIEPEMIAATESKLREAGLGNARVVRRDFVAEGTGMADASADYAMLFNILHAPESIALLQEAFRVLRPAGKAAIIHWNASDTPRGPAPNIRPRPEQCVEWLQVAGLDVALSPVALPPHHFGLVGVKPS